MKRSLLILLCVGAFAQAQDKRPPVDPAFSRLAPGTREKLEDLEKRLRKREAEMFSLPASTKRMQVEDELKSFCTASDLVELLVARQVRLRRSACRLLEGEYNAKLQPADIRRATEFLGRGGPEDIWRGCWAARALVRNEKLGIPALVETFRSDERGYARVNAAGVLVSHEAKVDPQAKREAQMVLLRALSDAGDLGNLTSGYCRPLDPWMVQWLAENILTANEDSPLCKRGVCLLSSHASHGPESVLRPVFLRALGNPTPYVRVQAVIGFTYLGLRDSDRPLYRTILKDTDPNVRRLLYVGLSERKAPWCAPLLLAGLDDTAQAETVETCALGLVKLKHKAAVPKLVGILKRTLDNPRANGVPSTRVIGSAIAQLIGETYDFAQQTECTGGFAPALFYVNRRDVYRKEATRMLRWWEEVGAKQKW